MRGAFVDSISPDQISNVHLAVYFNQSYSLFILLKLLAQDINTTDFLGRSPLMWAIMRGFLSACRILLSNGADPYITDYEGKTAFHWACALKNTECLSQLMSYDVLRTVGKKLDTTHHMLRVFFIVFC